MGVVRFVAAYTGRPYTFCCFPGNASEGDIIFEDGNFSGYF